MRLVSCALIAATAILDPLSAGIAHAAGSPSVVIGEVAWAGSSLSTADEWIELWNTGDTTATIGGWSLTGAGSSGAIIPFPANAVIPPFGTYLISNYEASDTKSALDIAPNVVTTTISLSNSALRIDLVDDTGAITDTAGDGGPPPAGTSLPDKASMVRQEVGWMTATSSQDLDLNVADFGTPGVCDGCASPTVTGSASDVTTSTGSLSAPSTATSTSMTDPPFSTTTSTPHDAGTTSTSSDVLTDTTSTEIDTTTIDVLIDATSTTDTDATTTVTEAGTIDQTNTTTDDATASTSTNTETVSIASTTASSGSTETNDQTTDSAQDAPPPAYQLLRLNEFMPAPPTGEKEWIEIVSLDTATPIDLTGVEIHDATGRIHTISNITIDPTESRYAVIQLPSAKLNNGGDTVALYAPDGRLLDAISYTSSKKEQSYVRYPDTNGDWVDTDRPTPGNANLPFSPPAPDPTPQPDQTTAPDQTAPQPIGPEAVPTTIQTITKAPPNASPTPTPVTKKKTTPPSPGPLDLTSIPVAQTTPKTSATKTRSATKTKTSTEPVPLTFDMTTSDEYGGLRVRLTGRVGTPPGLLTNHGFVLQAPDGRGLNVSLTTARKLPPTGADITVIGTLLFDKNNIPHLSVHTTDGWIQLPTSTDPVPPRIVDLTAPSTEDAWSLMSVTGTVTNVKSSSFDLDLGDAGLTVLVRSVVKYRVARLTKGDQIVVTGVLDTTVDPPRLLPRTADDIRLMDHAVSPLPTTSGNTASNTPMSLPPWTPLGAAGSAIAVTEGAKQFTRRRRKKKLERTLATMTDGDQKEPPGRL